MNKPLLALSLLLSILSIPSIPANADYLISSPGELLLKENFDRAELPALFRSGAGDWAIVDNALRGQERAKDKHTAFRKIPLDHQDVIYEFDMKIEGDAFSQLLINYELVHLAKCVTRLDKAEIYKVLEQKKREQMAKEGRDQGNDPLKGNWDEKTFAIDKKPLSLKEGEWIHVIIELVGDQIAMQVNGIALRGGHIGLSEKKTNFGFQAGGQHGHVYYDNIRVWKALPSSANK